MNVFKHQCACGKEFKQKKNLYAHMRKQHGIEPLQLQRGKIEKYECDFCGRKVICKSSLVRHFRQYHSDTANNLIGVNKKSSLNCPHGKCAEIFRNYEVLREHLNKKHEFEIDFEELSFDSIEEFEQWKDKMQLKTASFYTQSTAGRTLRIELGHRQYYNCHRSNVYKQRGNNRRALKSLGSNKIGKACPSRLEVTYTEYAEQMIIKVKFWKTHCGHTNQVERLPLNREMKISIAEKLNNGFSYEQIVEWIRDNRQPDEVSERLQLISKKDIYNILREFNIKLVKKNTTKPIINKFQNCKSALSTLKSSEKTSDIKSKPSSSINIISNILLPAISKKNNAQLLS